MVGVFKGLHACTKLEVLVLRSDSATFDGPAPALRELAKVTVGPHHALTNLNMAD
jgi:hypothetical protein